MNFVRRHLVTIVIAVLAFLLGVGAGGAGEVEEDDAALRQDRADLAEQVEALEASLADAAQLAETERTAKESAQAEVEAELGRLARTRRELQAKLRKVNAQARTIEQNTFGDGIWQVGTDIDAGTYRSPGGDGCYWALLGSADTSDIINNGGFTANQTITIDSPFFQTAGCGEWRKL